MPDGPFAHALAAHFGLVAQRQVQDAALAAVHGAEVERLAGALDALGGGQRAHAQFLDAQHAVIVGVEAHARMFFGRHPQRFHGQLLERQQQLGLVAQQQIHIRAAEPHQNVRILEIRMPGAASWTA